MIKFYHVIAIVVLFVLPTTLWAQQENAMVAVVANQQQGYTTSIQMQKDSTTFAPKSEQPRKKNET